MSVIERDGWGESGSLRMPIEGRGEGWMKRWGCGAGMYSDSLWRGRRSGRMRR